jgi:hypothetical protein
MVDVARWKEIPDIPMNPEQLDSRSTSAVSKILWSNDAVRKWQMQEGSDRLETTGGESRCAERHGYNVVCRNICPKPTICLCIGIQNLKLQARSGTCTQRRHTLRKERFVYESLCCSKVGRLSLTRTPPCAGCYIGSSQRSDQKEVTRAGNEVKGDMHAHQVLDRQLWDRIVHTFWYGCIHIFNKLFKIGFSSPIEAVVL